ncbi:ATP-binding cassette domain-containing protein [Mycoplasma capricolum subsp. capripneumoniae]|nr:ATP-binding cassette domain-containing protein [Mycoplasma capricolum subsp. capripneumoniae]QIN43172.1 ATP-binding cassette domain-containing protein [Mycoplasma capricolum subsp. capripneumoniae]QIN43852.1 ATP-binding cassette domain-containing protein [Mycoplasma capricolum subsp. capripneumoniae]QIN44540.1 ATP-binding cassette domain-containing protein [Mycoplasma capricolum subsp. capripneumoniae]QIN45902.1 ATP-binding cassette domain-containing protein [Mycoplasma capricolum subsp. cap
MFIMSKVKKVYTKIKKKWSFDNTGKFTLKKFGLFIRMNIEIAKKNPLLFFGVVFFTSLDAIFAAMLPLFSSKVITTLVQNNKQWLFNWMELDSTGWVYVIAINLGIIIICEYFTNFKIALYSAQIEVMQRLKILKALTDQDVDFYFDHVSGNILTRLVGDTQFLALGVQQFLTNLIYALSGSITAITIMYTQNLYMIATLSLVYLLIANLFCVGFFIDMRRKLILAFDIKRETDADMTDKINNISLIKASGTEEFEIKRLEEKNKDYEDGLTKFTHSSALLNTSLTFVIQLLVPIIFIIIAVQYLTNNQSSNSLGADIALIFPLLSTLIGGISILLPSLRSATAASNAANRISELTDPKPMIHSNLKGYKIDKIDSIVFDNISFSYPKKPERIVIPPTKLIFEKGKIYAFVGQTGSGKTTIAKLLLRFYAPTDGKILINGEYNLNRINLPAYLNHIGYVEQEPQILYGTFLDNIKYSKFDATDEEVIQACKKAELHDFIMSLPDKYHTILGQRGFILSGGQKQRLVIARVFLKDPDVVILDEATSALDNVVEKEIQDKLDELIKGRMCITIAHRLTTIKNVDEIYVLGPNGIGIVQMGTFDQLKKQPGHFRNLYEAGLME